MMELLLGIIALELWYAHLFRGSLWERRWKAYMLQKAREREARKRGGA